MPSGVFDIRLRLRLWRQRRRKKRIQQQSASYGELYSHYRRVCGEKNLDVLIPSWRCWKEQCAHLRLFREQEWLRGVEVHCIVPTENIASPQCSMCNLRQEAERMKGQEERMMQQEERSEPDNARWRVLLRLYLNGGDSQNESHL